jgi:hypothetical protein
MNTTPQNQQTGPGMSPDEAANWREQTIPTSPGLLVLMGVVIAVPMLVAGWVIARRRG